MTLNEWFDAYEKAQANVGTVANDLQARRMALKVGDVIKDPALLAPGMRVTSFDGTPLTVVKRASTYWTVNEQGWQLDDSVTISTGRTFLGWATEEKPVGLSSAAAIMEIHDIQMERIQRLAGVDWTKSVDWNECTKCGATICLCGAQAWKHGPLKPIEPPKALPFKRNPFCGADHTQPVMCLRCEAIYAKDAEEDAKSKAMFAPPESADREPHQPSATGLGGVVGPVLSRIR